MRQLFLFNLVLLFSVSTFSQERKHQLDISAFPYYNFVVLQTCDGTGGMENAPGIRLGIQYNYRLDENKWFNTGIFISSSTHTYTGAVTDPTDPVYKVNQTAVVVQVPLRFKYEFKNQFYLKPGVSIDIQTQKDSEWHGSLQNGIGLSIAGGYDLDLHNKWHLSFEPEMSYLSMIQLPLGQRDNCHEHFLYLGLNVNFGFKFK